MRFWVRWSTWLCLSLMLWTVAAESTHNHPKQTESASCSICVVAHSASPTVSSGHTGSSICRHRPAARRRRHRQGPVRFFEPGHSRSSCPVGIPNNRTFRAGPCDSKVPAADSLFTTGGLMPTFYLPISYRLCKRRAIAAVITLSLTVSLASAQSVGNSGSVNGTVLDSTGAVVPNAKVEIRNPVSGFDRSTTTDSAGKVRLHEYSFQSLPPDRHRRPDSCVHAQDVEPRSVGAGRRCRQTRSRRVDHGGDRRSRGRRPGGERFHLPHRRGQEPVRQAAAGEPIVVGEFAGNALDSGNLRRFQRPVPRTGRPRGEFVLASTASPSPISRAKFSPTRFRWTRFSRWK